MNITIRKTKEFTLQHVNLLFNICVTIGSIYMCYNWINICVNLLFNIYVIITLHILYSIRWMNLV